MTKRATKTVKRAKKSVKSPRDLPAKRVKLETASGIRGGGKTKPADPKPTESVSLSYGQIKFEYNSQD